MPSSIIQDTLTTYATKCVRQILANGDGHFLEVAMGSQNWGELKSRFESSNPWAKRREDDAFLCQLSTTLTRFQELLLTWNELVESGNSFENVAITLMVSARDDEMKRMVSEVKEANGIMPFIKAEVIELTDLVTRMHLLSHVDEVMGAMERDQRQT